MAERSEESSASDIEVEKIRRIDRMEAEIAEAANLKKAYEMGVDRKLAKQERKKERLLDQQRQERDD